MPSVDSRIFNPVDPGFVRDPYAIYAQLREYDPVHRSAFGYVVLTRHEHVAEALGDGRFSNAPAPFALVHRRNRERHVASAVANNIVPFKDAPEHTPPRGLLAATLKAAVRNKKPVVEAIAADLLDRLQRKGSVEFVQDFSVPFAVLCVCRIMGLAEHEASQIKEWSSGFFSLFQPIPNAGVEKVDASLRAFREYIRGVIEARKTSPRDDLITALAEASRRGYSLTEEELIDNTMLLVADGIENVQSGLATSVATLLRHPDQLRLMMGRPELIDPAVEECLRFEAPGQYQGRIATEDIEIGEATIKANSIVFLVLASANRDPRALSDPDRFQIERQGFRHLSFGAGRHACIGAALVEMEFQAALAAIFDGSRQIELADKEIAWTARAGHRWPAELPLYVSNNAGLS
jgi:cytochrome P450